MNLLYLHTNFVFLLIFNIFLIINAKDFKNDVTTSATPTTTLQRSTAAETNSESDSLTKRDIKTTDLSTANTISGKSYDPPPEFYRGPGSTGHYSSSLTPPYYNHNYKPSSDFISKPIAFPDSYNNNYNKYAGAAQDNSNNNNNNDVHLANSFNSWQHLKGKVGALLNKKGTLQDRISVGHYGTPDHGSGTANTGLSGGYTYDSRPYGGGGGPPHHVEYQHYGGGGGASPSAHPAGYYGGSGSAEGIPFDVYGTKNHYSGSSGGGDYNTYSYPDVHEPAAHKTHPDLSHKALLAKSFLIPLASAAVLGIAAALVSNPLLLQLGTVSGVAPGAAVFGKRKRRDLTASIDLKDNHYNSNNEDNTNNLDLAVKKDSTLLPYRAHRYRRFVRT